jgi:hypothetical protein
MTETPGAATEPLLREVTAEQHKLLTIVGDVVADTGAWPTLPVRPSEIGRP